MTVEIRRITEDELVPFVDAIGVAFLERPDAARIADEVRPHWDLDRVWAAFDDGRVCGTFRSWATELTVPGGAQLPAAAVAAVTVLPTHRRRGILGRMTRAEHAALRERGEALSLLYASEYPIYGRFGYGPGGRQATWTLDALATGFARPTSGSVELAGRDEEARRTISGVFDSWRRRSAGEIRRRDFIWEYDLGRETGWGQRWNGFLALRRDAAGEVDGYARYHPEERWENRQPRNSLVVDDLHALNDEAYAALWSFLAATDLVSTVKAERRSPAERLPWLLTNARAAVVSEIGDGMWVRLHDLPTCLASRVYDRSGSLVIEAIDPEAPGGRVRVHLDAGPDGARCETTDRDPDLTLDIAALGAAYLGGTRLRDAVAAAGVDEHRAGSLGDADALFATLDEPWTSTFF